MVHWYNLLQCAYIKLLMYQSIWTKCIKWWQQIQKSLHNTGQYLQIHVSYIVTVLMISVTLYIQCKYHQGSEMPSVSSEQHRMELLFCCLYQACAIPSTQSACRQDTCKYHFAIIHPQRVHVLEHIHGDLPPTHIYPDSWKQSQDAVWCMCNLPSHL